MQSSIDFFDLYEISVVIQKIIIVFQLVHGEHD